MARKITVPGFDHDKLHKWKDEVVHIENYSNRSYGQKLVSEAALEQQVNAAKLGHLFNVRVQGVPNADKTKMIFYMGKQPAYCQLCTPEYTGEKFNRETPPQRMTTSGINGGMRPMTRQEEKLHLKLQKNPKLIPDSDTVKASRKLSESANKKSAWNYRKLS